MGRRCHIASGHACVEYVAAGRFLVSPLIFQPESVREIPRLCDFGPWTRSYLGLHRHLEPGPRSIFRIRRVLHEHAYDAHDRERKCLWQRYAGLYGVEPSERAAAVLEAVLQFP